MPPPIRPIVTLLVLTLVAGCAYDDDPFGLSSRTVNPYAAPRTRWYFIAADEVEWDYAPLGFNRVTGQEFDDVANVFVQQGDDRIGDTYWKVLYRQYTDGSFSDLAPVAPEWEHLGAMGPLIRAVVGDTIKILFRNNTICDPECRPYTMHPHGVFYEKDSEGAPYDDGTSGDDKADDLVMPGETHLYTWVVPPRAGPGPMDPSSILWMYHSHVDETRDTYTGLVGPIIVMAPGTGVPNGRPRDVDREFVTLFVVGNENASWLIDRNIEEFAGDPGSVDPADPDFEESNLMHGINGLVFGNLEGLTMREGERVRWYVMGLGTEVDIHTPHWHGQTGLWAGMRTDVLEIFPASMKVFDMQPDNPGTWLLHCHVNDHLDAGMITVFTVQPR